MPLISTRLILADPTMPTWLIMVPALDSRVFSWLMVTAFDPASFVITGKRSTRPM